MVLGCIMGDPGRAERIVVKISGKLISPDHPELVEDYAAILGRLEEEGYRVAVVVGGGHVARRYINAARRLGSNEAILDLIGIAASRMNAYLLALALGGKAYPLVARGLEEFMAFWSTGKIVVAGGFQPGQSTNAVSAILAEAIGSKLIINCSTVDGVYDKDPRIHPDARMLPRVTVSELVKILSRTQSHKAGKYELLDPIAMRIMLRSRIRLAVINGFNPENLARLLGGESVGSMVEPE